MKRKKALCLDHHFFSFNAHNTFRFFKLRWLKLWLCFEIYWEKNGGQTSPLRHRNNHIPAKNIRVNSTSKLADSTRSSSTASWIVFLEFDTSVKDNNVLNSWRSTIIGTLKLLWEIFLHQSIPIVLFVKMCRDKTILGTVKMTLNTADDTAVFIRQSARFIKSAKTKSLAMNCKNVQKTPLGMLKQETMSQLRWRTFIRKYKSI